MNKKTAEKDEELTDTIKTVMKALDKFKENTKKRFKVEEVYCDSRYSDSKVWCLLDKKKGIFTEANKLTISGVMANRYNTSVFSCLDALYEFDLLDKKQITEFKQWLHKKDREQVVNSEVARAREIANRNGYKLTPVQQEDDSDR